MNDLIVLNKPYGVICQFSVHEKYGCLKDYVALPDFYPAGRLDADSEGLLLLTNDGRLQARIADPKFKLEKTYWAQVEGSPDEAKLDLLRRGVDFGRFCHPSGRGQGIGRRRSGCFMAARAADSHAQIRT